MVVHATSLRRSVMAGVNDHTILPANTFLLTDRIRHYLHYSHETVLASAGSILHHLTRKAYVHQLLAEGHYMRMKRPAVDIYGHILQVQRSVHYITSSPLMGSTAKEAEMSIQSSNKYGSLYLNYQATLH